MGKKFLIYIGILFLIAGVLAAIKFAGDNRSTVVGDASRYNIETSSGGVLTRSVGGSGTGAVHKVRDGESIQAAVAAAQAGDIISRNPNSLATS